jgi:hypothetical protein
MSGRPHNYARLTYTMDICIIFLLTIVPFLIQSSYSSYRIGYWKPADKIAYSRSILVPSTTNKMFVFAHHILWRFGLRTCAGKVWFFLAPSIWCVNSCSRKLNKQKGGKALTNKTKNKTTKRNIYIYIYIYCVYVIH